MCHVVRDLSLITYFQFFHPREPPPAKNVRKVTAKKRPDPRRDAEPVAGPPTTGGWKSHPHILGLFIDTIYVTMVTVVLHCLCYC